MNAAPEQQGQVGAAGGTATQPAAQPAMTGVAQGAAANPSLGWYGVNPATGQPYTAAQYNAATGSPTAANSAGAGATGQPSNASTIASLGQPQYLGAPATVAPSTVSTQGLDPNATIAALIQSFQPQDASSTNNLNQTLADFGVTGGQAVGSMQQLQAQLQAAQDPSIAAAIQSSQGNILNAGEFNASAGNTASTYNANALNQTNAANVGQANQSQEQMLQDILNSYYAQLGAFSNINDAGQSGGNQNAVNYGQTVTTSDPFAQIFSGLTNVAAGAASNPVVAATALG